jgi:hypothetical protein
MNLEARTHNTLPSNKDLWWQFVTIPTAAIFRNNDKSQSYTAITLEWLFWSATIIINDKTTISHF